MSVATEKCPCGWPADYRDCCGRLHAGQIPAETAEQLMRARYSAYARQLADYLYATTHPAKRSAQLKPEILSWAQQVEFFRLEVLNCRQGGRGDKIGKVEFIAHYRPHRQPGDSLWLRELSRFRRFNGLWHYVDGELSSPIARGQ